MRRTEAEIARLVEEAVAVTVALLAFTGENDVNLTAGHTVSLIATRERMETQEALSLARAVKREVARVAGQADAAVWLLPADTLAVMPPAGHA